jgi:tRNA-dihydrouridine synthase
MVHPVYLISIHLVQDARAMHIVHTRARMRGMRSPIDYHFVGNNRERITLY